MMSWNNDSNHNTEQVVAVAAAAYVIDRIAESSIHDQKRSSAGLEPSLIEDKSRREGEGSMKGSESAESKVPVTDATDGKATRPAPSFNRPLTFADHIGSTSSTKPKSNQKPESAAPKPDLPTKKRERAAPKPDLPTIEPVSTAPKPDHPTIKPGTTATQPEQPPTFTPAAPVIEVKRQSAARPETKAEEWEKAEMAKIKERYMKLNSTILAWEEKKKKKAKNKLGKAESELEKKRARALSKYRNEMEYIKQVAEGARAQAEARQRNDELKAKEKANIIRTTGKVPRTCFCC
ncbi:remorin isoform X2 [Herrania umbratica]|nr:remorin isoform X2 [Herrania umbratica]XP_021299788.1 remorin isoform X2 [Herrania umbratica]